MPPARESCNTVVEPIHKTESPITAGICGRVNMWILSAMLLLHPQPSVPVKVMIWEPEVEKPCVAGLAALLTPSPNDQCQPVRIENKLCEVSVKVIGPPSQALTVEAVKPACISVSATGVNAVSTQPSESIAIKKAL